jgi:hypothetical protein
VRNRTVCTVGFTTPVGHCVRLRCAASATPWRMFRLGGLLPRRWWHPPLEERAKWPLAVVAEQPDLTLEEIVAAMQKRRTAGSRTGVWQLFARHDVTFKKDNLRAAEQLWPDVAPLLAVRAVRV